MLPISISHDISLSQDQKHLFKDRIFRIHDSNLLYKAILKLPNFHL